MKKILIDDELKSMCNISLGCIFYKAAVKLENVELWNYIENILIKKIKKEFSSKDITIDIQISAARECYKALGKDPSRYRVSSEALIRRILNDKGLYKINNVVDANNLISIETKYSVGSYDLDKIKGDIKFRIGNIGEEYQGIGKDSINLENLPVFVDEIGPYGSPTSDSRRAMITNDSKNILTVLISFNGSRDLEKHVEYAKNQLIKYVDAKDIECIIIYK